MFGKHIKASCIILVLCLIIVMFLTVTILNGNFDRVSNSVGEIVLLIFVVAAIVPVFVAHRRS